VAQGDSAPAETGGLVIERIFEAPREAVWRAWTEAERFARWYGPQGFTVPVCQIDPRVGGRLLICMRSPDGKDFWYTGVFKEIDPPARFVHTESLADASGNVVPATHYGMSEDFPLETLVTVSLEEEGAGKTRMTLRHEGLPAGAMEEGAQQGWSQAFDKLTAALTQA